ncbi:MAG: SPASM domain-containing protein [Lachnospiraceae bacterium]|nr:SPASM domain-containing protein [Lachnospiraceae bacterium]
MRENFLWEGELDTALPEKIYIEPTDMCNLNCSICFRHGWINEEAGMMDMPVFLKLCEELSNLPSVKEVFFGGMGEPLIHESIAEMVRTVPQHLKKTLITNGNLLNEEMTLKLISAGLSELWISLDGFAASKSEGIQTGTSFSDVIQNIEAFNRIRSGKDIRLCISMVVSDDNVSELSKIDDFADEYGIDMINVSHQIPGSPVFESNTDDTDAYGGSLANLRFPVGKMRRLRKGVYNPVEDICPFIDSNAVFIKWNGDVVPCMQLLHSCHTYLYEEERTITSFSYGNIHEKPLLDCWNDTDYSHFRKRVREFYFPFCRHCTGCEDRKGNLSDCFLTESPACGACLWASGRVFCP